MLLESNFWENFNTNIAAGIALLIVSGIVTYIIKKREKNDKEEVPKTTPTKTPCDVLSSFSPINKNEVIGRENDLTAITLKLENTNTILLLNGIGGIGKTTLATLYAQTHKEQYYNLVWINAAQGIYKGFVSDTTLAHKLNLTDTLQKLQEQQPDNFEEQGTELLLNTLLDKTNGLLIIDNEQQEQHIVDAVKAKLQGSGNWKILITARETLTGIEPYEVEVLDEAAAQKLFYQYYTKEQNDTLVDEINELLLRHTLMVELMARVAQNRDGYSLTQLKKDLETTKLNFAKDDKVESNHWGTGDTKTQRLNAFLQTAFTIAEFELQENDSEEEKNEKQQLRQLLTYWCLMPEKQTLKLDWFCELCKITDEEKNETNTQFNQLVKTGWLQKENEEYLMHPVIQQALRWQLQPQPQSIEGMIQGLIDQMAVHFYEKHTLIGAFNLQPYIQSVLRYFHNPNHFTKSDYTKDWETISTLITSYSLYFTDIGNYNKALEFALKALTIREEVLEPKHPDLAISYNNIALIYQDKGDLEKALEFALKALTIKEEVLEPKHPSLVTSYNNIADIYQDKGDLEKALEFALKALTIREGVLEPKHPDLAISYNNIALIYKDKGDLEKAFEFALKALTIREEVLEPKHPSLAISYSNIATIYKDKGDLEKALEFALKALTIREEVLEPKHPDLAKSYNNIALIYKDKGDLEKALEFALKALTIKEKVLEPKHPSLATSYSNIALIYQYKGDLEKALEFALKDLTIREEVLEPKHPSLAISYNNIASIYYSKEEYAKAKKYIDQAIEIMEYNFPNGHPNLDTSKYTQKKIEEKLEGS